MKMWFRNIAMTILVLFIVRDYTGAQQTSVKADSTQLYENIESFSKRTGFTKFLYHILFKPVAKSKPVKKKEYKKLIQNPYSSFQGKTIRHINIITLDPFGYTIADTNSSPHNFVLIAGNKLHIKSQSITIRNLLLIRQNQLFDTLLVKESERLVRSMAYVHDVSFQIIETSKNSDSVDIFIRELDNWSIIPRVNTSASSLTINLADKNFLGLGHNAKIGATWDHTNGDFSYLTNYSIPNIRNTFISTTAYYGIDEFGNYKSNFSIDRPFFSPLTKWATGISFTQQFFNDSIFISNSFFVQQRFKWNIQDYWAGYAIPVFKRNAKYKGITNFIIAARYLGVRYLENPIEAYDTLHMFCNEDFFLVSMGISTRKYVQDKFIFKYGVIEDVPSGKVLNLTAGYQIYNNMNRFYVSARIAFGHYYPWGYLGFSSEYGTFFKASQAQQGTFTASLDYFTGLLEIGRWKFRQFVKPQVVFGINRFSTDSLTLNDGYGLDGFKSSVLTGTNRLLLKLQTQSYTPWNLIGFRFGPYIMCSLGMLGNDETGFYNNKVYTQFGLGVIINNDHFIFNTFQISISYYPTIPGKGENIFKANSFRTTDFGFKDFEIGKPSTMIFL